MPTWFDEPSQVAVWIGALCSGEPCHGFPQGYPGTSLKWVLLPSPISSFTAGLELTGARAGTHSAESELPPVPTPDKHRGPCVIF